MTDVLRMPLIAAFAVLGLVACASEKTIPVSQPARSTFAPAVDSSRLIYVTPMEGVSGPARLVLADAVAAALRDAGKPAVLAEKANEAGPTVAGKVTGVQASDTVLWVTAEWALQAPHGAPVAEYRQLIVVDRNLWEKGSAEAINLVVSDAGPMIAGMVRDYVGPTLTAETPPADATAAAKPAQAPAKPTPAPPKETAAADKPAPAAPAKPSPAPPKETADAPSPAKESTTATTEPPPPAKEAAPKETPPLRAHSTRPKSISRQPPKPPVALETAKAQLAKAVDAEAAEPDEQATPAAAPPREKTPPSVAAGQPTLLTKGAPPRQPRPKPVEEAVRTKPLLMPVPEDKPKLTPDPPPVTWSKPSFLIKPVEGAPGDGNVALTNAMRDALRKRDLTVTDDPRQAGFVIEGRVQVSPSVNGRQQTKIIWAVNTITGQEVGKAVQENAVQAGSLDGQWGRIADIVTNAAVVGIQELFGVEEKRASSLNLPPVPPLPNLPQVPGRAMPPPR